jgi:hypothetical protein
MVLLGYRLKIGGGRMASHANKHIREAINMQKRMAGNSRRQAAEPTFTERSGVVNVTVMVAVSACFRRRAFRRIMRGGFAVPSILVRTEGTTT